MSLMALIFALVLNRPQNQASHSVLAAKHTAAASSASSHASPITPLAFKEFFEPSPQELKPSAKLLGCNGRRVRIVGFMVQMEEPIKGGFYLCPRPVFCDEGGGGTGDLPPETVRVIVRSAKGKQLAHRPQALEVTGILEVGAKTDEEGQVSMLRLTLDRPANVPKTALIKKHGSTVPAVKSNTRSTKNQ